MKETEEALRTEEPALPEAVPALPEESAESVPAPVAESVPAPAEEIIDLGGGSETPSPGKPRHARPLLFLRRGIPLLLSGISAAVFGLTALSAALSAGFTGERMTRLLLGDFAGGAAYVHPVYASPSPVNPPPIEEAVEEALPSLPPAEEPEESEPRQTEEEPVPADTMEKPESDLTDSPETAAESAPVESPEKTPAAESAAENLILSNETAYTPDMRSILALSRAIEPQDELTAVYGAEAPLVLILHTHATEAYSDSEGARSTDSEKSVVSLGQRIADYLNGHGVPTLHDDTLFDEPDFTMAYYNASRAIRKALETYPSLSYIVDLHRDSVKDSDGNELPLLCETEAGSAARLMLVMGTDDGGADHGDWQKNLSLAARLQVALNETCPGLMRNINLRSASFNEQYTPGSLLLEVGSGGNTMEEAERAADLFAEALLREIRGEG